MPIGGVDPISNSIKIERVAVESVSLKAQVQCFLILDFNSSRSEAVPTVELKIKDKVGGLCICFNKPIVVDPTRDLTSPDNLCIIFACRDAERVDVVLVVCDKASHTLLHLRPETNKFLVT